MSDLTKLARDLAVMIATAGGILVALYLLGPVVALILGAILLPVAALIVLVLMTLGRALDDVDERCSRIDQQLDQEQAARDALRVQRTVHAEPQAPVIDFFSGDRIA